jgi:hypothetical protein
MTPVPPGEAASRRRMRSQNDERQFDIQAFFWRAYTRPYCESVPNPWFLGFCPTALPAPHWARGSDILSGSLCYQTRYVNVASDGQISVMWIGGPPFALPTGAVLNLPSSIPTVRCMRAVHPSAHVRRLAERRNQRVGLATGSIIMLFHSCNKFDRRRHPIEIVNQARRTDKWREYSKIGW